jgi:hypothetical protein
MALALPTSDLALLTGALRQLLGACLPESGVLALRVVASDLTRPQTAQLTLFPEPMTSRAQVAAVVANLSPRVRGQIYQAQLVAPQARCPEQQAALTPWEGV